MPPDRYMPSVKMWIENGLLVCFMQTGRIRQPWPASFEAPRVGVDRRIARSIART